MSETADTAAVADTAAGAAAADVGVGEKPAGDVGIPPPVVTVNLAAAAAAPDVTAVRRLDKAEPPLMLAPAPAPARRGPVPKSRQPLHQDVIRAKRKARLKEVCRITYFVVTKCVQQVVIVLAVGSFHVN